VTHLSCKSNAGGWGDNRPACCPGCAFMGLPAMHHGAPGCSRGWSKGTTRRFPCPSSAYDVRDASVQVYVLVKHVLLTMSSIFRDMAQTSSDLQTWVPP
jgi:hypothetical protein